MEIEVAKIQTVSSFSDQHEKATLSMVLDLHATSRLDCISAYYVIPSAFVIVSQAKMFMAEIASTIIRVALYIILLN
jgi:hypothetical protein